MLVGVRHSSVTLTEIPRAEVGVSAGRCEAKGGTKRVVGPRAPGQFLLALPACREARRSESLGGRRELFLTETQGPFRKEGRERVRR